MLDVRRRASATLTSISSVRDGEHIVAGHVRPRSCACTVGIAMSRWVIQLDDLATVPGSLCAAGSCAAGS